MTAFPNKAPASWTSLTFPAGLQGLNTANSVLSTDAIANGTGRYDWITLAIVLNTFNPTGTPPIVGAALIPEFDGNYATVPTGSTLPYIDINYPYCQQQITTGSSAKYVNLVFLPPLPFNYKVLVINQSGVSFAGSGNTVKWSGTLKETL